MLIHIEYISRRLAFIALLFLVLPVFSSAQIQVRTVIPAEVNDNPLVVSNEKAGNISFSFATIPLAAKIVSCEMMIVVEEDIAYKIPLQMRDAENDILYDNMELGKRDTAGSVIVMELDSKQMNFQKSSKLNIALKIKIGNPKASASFFPASMESPGNAPRLVVHYTIGKPFSQYVTSWASARTNAQHIAQTTTLIKGAIPSSYEIKPLNDYKSVVTDPVMGNGKVYIVNNNDNKTFLNAIDPVTGDKQVIANDLKPARWAPVIDPYGHLFYFTENDVTVYDLHTGFAKKVIDVSTKEIIHAPPTIGPDGSLYLIIGPSRQNSMIRAYSPYPQCRLTWIYAIGDESVGSTVSLTNNGTKAYVAVKRNESGSLVSINTANGRELKAVPVEIKSIGDNESPAIPLIDINDYVYVPDKLTGTTNLDIFDSDLNKKTSISGDLSPVARYRNGVSFVLDGDLTHYDPGNDKKNKLATFTRQKLRSFVTDLSGYCYGLGENNILHIYTEALSGSIIQVPPSSGASLTQTAMIIAPDGVLYVCSSSTLFAFRARSFPGDYTLSNQDRNFMQATFRGNNVIVPENFNFTNMQRLVAPGEILFRTNVTLKDGANVVVESGKIISFQNGFHVKQGAVFVCKTGY